MASVVAAPTHIAESVLRFGRCSRRNNRPTKLLRAAFEYTFRQRSTGLLRQGGSPANVMTVGSAGAVTTNGPHRSGPPSSFP